MLVRERVRGDLLVQLDAKLQARPVELLRQRWSPDGRGTEHLVRWAEQNAEEVAGAGSSSSQAGGKSSSILMWMSAEEVDTNCPTLLGKRKPEEGQEENAPGSPNEGSLQEMREDVRTLVQRAARQMAQTPDPSILHTIHVLRAYATIASLAAVFKETGALDLLVEMLCNTDKQIRSNASKVLRALASHDAGSRTHILLALSQQDGMEQRMDFESRYTLLQLFAETSAEKQRISLEGIHLPQITGKRLFSLVKRYLRASSLLDQLTSDRPGKLRLQRQCDFGMAMGDLICELVRAMGWADESGDGVKLGAGQAYSRPAHPLWAPRRRRRFLVCSDFPHRGRYAEYLQHTLVPGMGVRMPENHQLLVAGDEGVFLQSILGTSSAQVYWHRLGRPHHVDWDALEIISCGERNEERAGYIAGHVTVTGLSPRGSSGAGPDRQSDPIGQEDWWELLLLVRQLEEAAQQRAMELIRGNKVAARGRDQPLYRMSVTAAVAQDIVALLLQDDAARSLLLMSHLYSKFCVTAGPHDAPSEGAPTQDCPGPHDAPSERAPTQDCPGPHDAPSEGAPTQDCPGPHDAPSERAPTQDCPGPHDAPSERAPTQDCPGPHDAPSERAPTQDCSGPHDAPCSGPPDAPCSGPHDAPCSGPPDAPSSGPPDAPSSGPPDAPCSGPPDAPCSGPPDAPCSGPPDAPCSGPPDAPCSGPHDAPCSGPHDAPCSGPHDAPCSGESALTTEPSDLQILNSLLLLEGLELSNTAGLNADHDADLKRSLESCRGLAHGVRHIGLERSSSMATLSERTLELLVELMTSQVREELVVVTCLQLAYLVMCRCDWRLRFATEGGVRSVLACMQQHLSSAAVQHAGLTVLKVLTGVGSCDQWRAPTCYTLAPPDAQVIKEIFSSIGSSSASLLRAIPDAVAKMMCVKGCSSSIYNGLLVIRMLTHNQQLPGMVLPDLAQSFLNNSQNSTLQPQHLPLADLIAELTEEESGPGLAVEKMDLMMILSGLKDSRMFRRILPDLERCVCGELPSPRCDLPQLLTHPHLFLQLLSCLERLGDEKRLQLSIYRILNKSLYLCDEDTLPWHKSIAPSLGILRASGGDRELLQEVVGFLHGLASLSKDLALLMCNLRAGELLNKVPEQLSLHSCMPDLKNHLTACEKYACLHNKMAASVVAGCMQIVLSQIDERRLSQRGATLPLLDVFLSGLAGACTGVEQNQDKCWERLEVSSNPQQAGRLTDGNPKSYWESSSSSGCHYITLHMRDGVLVRQLVLIVAGEDGSYMPAHVVVKGGEKPYKVNTELSTVNIRKTGGRILLLENATCYWPIIQILILRCHMGGIDTRVRGLEIQGTTSTCWAVFKEQLRRRTFLFYTSKAHTWGEQIHRKKKKLLQLLPWLNRTLSHEQEFAERFLPDGEAAQTLGRTCWEALICPLVERITTSGPGLESPLGRLLAQYLQNSEISRRPASRASAFNARVRRLTHLLLHVATSPAATSALKAPTKTNGKHRDAPVVPGPGMSSVARIAQCWQGVVQQHVQRFLERTWNDGDLVPRFCAVCLNLKRAMEEMFGQQAALSLALQEGICEGLLHLPFPNGIHVMKQFARYIDQLIGAELLDSSGAEPVEQLQQFLEWARCLADLELAASFEHFYRHYLANRLLLTLAPCWLENLVVDHIGACFPNRFPQQMLKSLQEAKDLRREEYLYRMQELDTGRLPAEAEEHGGKETAAQVEMSVLPSHCWPLSPDWFMDDPEKYFPSPVTASPRSFADFFRKRHSSSGSPGTAQRRLQWTWLGEAELQYGELNLRVSTLQMFILLQFNQREEIREEELRCRAGVSEHLLRRSLQPLTAQGGVLTLRPETGVLSVNPLCERAVTPLILSPAPAEDADIPALMEERHLLLQLIGRIMREEQEIHVDALVVKVLNRYRKLPESSPSCTATDVLSCVMSELRDGAIQRKSCSRLVLRCKDKTPPPVSSSPAPIMFHCDPSTPLPPQVSEFCSLPRVPSFPAETQPPPAFRTFRGK